MRSRLAGFSPDDVYLFRWVDHVRLDPDGGRLAFTLTRADSEARDYRSHINVSGTAGGADNLPREVGEGKKDRSPEWSPDGKRIAFSSRRRGREQVYVVDVESGDEVALTTFKDGASSPLWSPDGTQVACLGVAVGDPDGVVDDPRPPELEDQARRPPVARVAHTLDYKHDGQGYNDGRHRHLFVVDIVDGAGGDARQVTDGPWSVEGFDWAPQGRRWAITGNAEPDADLTTVKHVYVVEEGGGRRKLTDGLVASTPAWSPRGDLVAFIAPSAADGGRHERVWVVPPDGGEARCLTLDFDRSVGGSPVNDMRAGHAMQLVWSEDGDRIYFQASGPGTADICSVDLDGNVQVEVECRHGSVFDFDVRRGTLAYLLTDPWGPGDVYVKRDGAVTRLSEFNAWIRERDLAVPEKHVFRSEDGTEIDGWLLRPPGFTGGTAPLVLEVHGGPHGQYGWCFFHEFQVLASMGFLVFFTNPRGSDGRSEEFKRAVIMDWGGADFQDLMTALDQLIERTGIVDTARLGIAGGSYGGFMTNWAIGQTKRFAAAVTMRSISNLVSEYAQHDIVPWGHNELGPEPWPDPSALWERSPIRYVKEIETPLLILHGEMDLRCAISQAEELFGALRLLRKEAVMVRFPGESHDLSRSGRPDRRVERLVRIAGWFGSHLLRAEAAGGAEASPAAAG